ncbi:glycerophosphodiester phosphodiesterase family protein [Actinomadura sp. B10D3]|uniref:glycerophosphodiester phosphodiesterase family protein n=1 Tax=Actinomadura sp. B10D3 TaxID=3153557 RepID=UPI00325EC684
MRKVAIVGSGVVLAAAVALPGIARAPPEHMGRRNQAVIVGHRGSPGQAPEETLASYRNAVREGADVLEGDVQLTLNNTSGDTVSFFGADRSLIDICSYIVP